MYKTQNKYSQNKIYAKQIIDLAIKNILDRFGKKYKQKRNFLRVLKEVQDKSNLLKPQYKTDTSSWIDSVRYIYGIYNLTLYSRRWIHYPESWNANLENNHKCFHSLIKHLLCPYELPLFMDSVWLSETSDLEKQWHLDMGNGSSFRKLGIPINMTRTMEHYFLQAPHHYTVYQAMRYGQTRGLGGSKDYALLIADSPISNHWQDDDFWSDAIKLIVKEEDMDAIQLESFINKLYRIKFQQEEIVTINGSETLEPLDPHFDIRGRTFSSIMRMELPNRQYSFNQFSIHLDWKKSSINDYIAIESATENKEARVWAIRELLTSQEIKKEGQSMKNCVATYIPKCQSRKSGIWTMEMLFKNKVVKMVTIEVNLQKNEICQVKARFNKRPTDKCMQILKEWEKQEGLSLIQSAL